MSSAWGGFESADFGVVGAQAAPVRMSTDKKRGGWEDLRKQARQLENEIDLKLVSFGKLGTTFGSSSKPAKDDKEPLLGSSDQVFEQMSTEIGDLLSRLAQINDGMSEFASTQSQSAAIHHTLQRHRDILQDYRQEFTKTKSNIEAMMEREDLLTSVHRDISDYRTSNNRRMDLLMKESDHARNSERLIDEQINIAIDTRESLVNQRLAFKAIQTKLNDLTNRFPMINNLVQKINLRKRRDSIILGLVIGLCLVFMLWWMLS